MSSLIELGNVSRGRSRHRPRNDESLYGGKYPFVQTGDIKKSLLHVQNHTQTYNEKGLQQSKLWSKGTLCITIAANIAETAILSYDACFPDSIVGFTANPDKADVYYIKYYIDYLKLQMQQISKGTTQDNLSVDKLLSFDFCAPSPIQQRKIIAPLLNCDLLIEANNRRIEVLEEMAQKLYREWFVHFRFPGHENVKKVESELGMLPDGWKVKVTEDVFSYSRGKSYTSKEIDCDDGLPFINLKNIQSYGGFKSDGTKKISGKYKDSHIAQNGDIVLAVTDMTQERRLVGQAARLANITGNKAVISMDLIKINPLKYQQTDYIYSMFRFSELSKQIAEYANGANVLHLNPEVIMQQKLIVPPDDIILKYCDIASKIFVSIDIAAAKNTNLRKMRDLLLPRLISCDIDISKLEIPVEEECL